MNYFNYNGKVFKEGAAIIGPDNRGLRYGDGLFETMKMKNGTIIFEDEHFARLWKGMEILQFDIPRHFTAEHLQKEIFALAKKNNHESAARIRLNVIRGDGGIYDAKNLLPGFIVQTWPLPANDGEWNSNGLVLGFYESVRKTCDTLSNLKHNNYLPYIMAALHARKQQWNDAIVLNNHRRIADTTIANIFIVKDNVISTPALSEGCVAGIIRKMLIKELQIAGWELLEKELSATDILNADEVFLTNSMYHIRWVQSIENSTYKNTLARKIFTDILQTIL